LKKEVLLEIKGLSKNFGGIKAVNNVSFKLCKNEIVAIVGGNGAGKSTLIKIISGVYRKDSGEIYINNEKVNINDVQSARSYGLETVYQNQELISQFDVASNLFLGREKIRENLINRIFKIIDFNHMRKETEKILGKIGIKIKNIYSPVQNLSGGQRQGAVVGRAIYWGGKIIIFDEPTNNLGVKERKKVINLIKEIREKYKISIIIISHDLNDVFELVDRVIVLRNGEKIAERMKDKTSHRELVSLITGLE